MRKIHKINVILYALLLFFISCNIYADLLSTINNDVLANTSLGNTMPSMSSISLNPFQAIKQQTGADASADSFEIIGDNLIAKGNIRIRKGNILLYSDMIVMNNTTKTVELSGNVKFYNIVHSRLKVEYWELQTLERDPDIEMKIVGTVMTTTGRQQIVVDIMRKMMAWSGNKAIGNLNTGIFEFGKFATKLGGYTAIAKNAKRTPDGRLEINDAETSPCEDFSEGHSLFSIKSSKLVAYPSTIDDTRSRIVQNEYSPYAHFSKEPSTMSKLGSDDYNIWGYNNILYVGKVPVFWLPIVYKPALGDIGNWTVSFGQDSAWGTFINTTNHWDIVDKDNVQLSMNNMVDYYSKRGLALGNQSLLTTQDTKTELFVYGLLDRAPDINYPTFSRFGQMPENKLRYDLTLTNMSHIADGFDFRGQLAKLSDLYFLYNYFDNVALINPQPATYANLEYNNDYFNVGLTIRPRINTFYSVIESLPDLTLEVPRQEIWKGINYQSSTRVGYYQMKWRDFKISRAQAGLGNGVDPDNYESGRFDTVHFAYYPVKYEWVNFIPRAGVRLTAYSRSSKQKVSQQDLFNMFKAQQPEGRYDVDVVNYDGSGGSKVRFIGEIGAEINTKLSRQWTEVRNSYWELNGIRHEMVPYINYTFIPKPNVNRDNLYYFDDVDRIDEQNFARFGLQNRFQTKKGDWGAPSVYTWASMETYLDVIAHKSDEYYSQGGTKTEKAETPSQIGGMKYLGDIGHTMSFNASEAMSFNFLFLLDGQRLSTGDVLRSINKLSVSGNYKLAEGWSVNAGWYYGTNGESQGPYSMGSTFTRMQAGSVFERIFTASNNLYGGLNYKINERTMGTVSWSYQFENNMMPGFTFSIVRQLPCGLELLLDATVRDQANTNGIGKHTEFRWGASIGFSSSPNNIIQPRESLLPQSITRLANS